MESIHLTYHYNREYINNQFGFKANSLNTHTNNEVDNIIYILGSPSMLGTINNNGTHMVYIITSRYTNIKIQAEVDTLRATSYNLAETGNLLNQKVDASGNNVISCSLEATVFRCVEIIIVNGDDLNALALTQLLANAYIIDLRTEESFANMYLKVKGCSYIGLSRTNNITLYKYTAISGNLDGGEVLTFKRVPGVSDTNPLTIIIESLGGGTGVVYQSTASGQGFNIAYMTAQSSVAWVEGVNWGSSNEFIIKSGSNGLTLKPPGDVVISGNPDAGPSQAQTSINAHQRILATLDLLK